MLLSILILTVCNTGKSLYNSSEKTAINMKKKPKPLPSLLIKILFIAAILIITVRLIMPHAIKYYANKKIVSIEGFYGHIEDIDLSIIRNIYLIKNIRIYSDSSKQKKPFFQADSLSFTIEWSELFKGAISGSGILYKPEIDYIKSEKPEQKQAPSEGKPFTKLVKELFPFQIDIFKVVNGKSIFTNNTVSPNYTFYATNIDGTINNLTNSKKVSSTLYSNAHFTAQTMDGGAVTIDLSINPVSKIPQFSLDGTLQQFMLTSINDYLRSQSGITFSGGLLDFTTHLTTNQNQIKGYVIITLKGVNFTNNDNSLTDKLLEGLTESATEMMENSREQIKTKYAFTSHINEKDPDIIATIIGSMRDAIFDALLSKINPLE